MEFEKFWMGTEESLAMYLATMRAVISGELVQPGILATQAYTPDNSEDPPERMSRLVTKAGDLAIVKIAGPLNNTDSWLNEYRGMTGYPEIRDALIQVARDPEVQGVILDIHSGGGAVSGVFDTAKLIQQVDKIKPVHTFSDGVIASAAYLLGSSARSVTIGRMTEAGSIGVLQVHQEMSRMMKEAGITPTVMRAGKYKAMGNPYEPLSEDAKAQIQGQLDHMYQVFVEHVSDRRGVSYAAADKNMAQGRVFVGDQAKEAGLVDAVASFDDVATKLQKGIDSKKRASQSAPNFTQGKLVANTPLTEQEIAALALGAGAGAAAGATQTEAAAPTATTAEGAGEGTAAAAPTTTAGGAAAAAPAAAAPVAPAETQLVALLRSQLAEKDDKIVAQAVELREKTAEVESLKTASKGMRSIAEDSVTTLRVALNKAGGPVADMTDAALLAEQASLRAAFNEKFKAGGVASVPSTEKKGSATVDPNEEVRRQARLAATR